MASPGEHDHASDTVAASLDFFVDTGEKPVTYAPEPGAGPTQRTGSFRQHAVGIRDGRPLVDRLALDREGFLLTRHDTLVSDFYDAEEVRAVYHPELENLVKEVTGARKVVVFDTTLRTDDPARREEKNVREPVQLAHNDYTERSGPQRVRDLLPHEAEALLERRFAIINVWRSIRGEVESMPLAVCDARSIAASDLIAAERRTRDRVGEVQHLVFNPDQRWFYFPHMQKNEALVIKCYDSATDGRARFAAHAAFDHPTTSPDARPRESIEARSFAFF